MSKRRKEIDYETKTVTLAGRRYIVCRNHQEAEKDAADRASIVAALERQLAKGDKALVGNTADPPSSRASPLLGVPWKRRAPMLLLILAQLQIRIGPCSPLRAAGHRTPCRLSPRVPTRRWTRLNRSRPRHA